MPASKRQALHIAVGVLTNEVGEVLIAQRPAGKAGAGEWEFPGGKRHPGETVVDALTRELREELGIEVGASSPLIRIRHAYPDRDVLLDTWWVDRHAGQPRGAEGQAIAWVRPEALPEAGLLEADAPIANAIRLPQAYAISPPQATSAELHAWLEAPRAPMLRLRLPTLANSDYWPLWNELHAAARARGVTLMADRLPDESIAGGASAHLSAADASKLRRRPAGVAWFACSCHTAEDLRHAAKIGADFAVLGQVKATPSHRERPPLGWTRWQRLVDAAQLPVYGIGGLSDADIAQTRAQGGQGVAAIRAYW